MKNLILNILISLFVLCITGCVDEYYLNSDFTPSLSSYYLHLSETSFTHNYSSEFTKTFTVESFETSWEFTEVADWLSISPMSGNSSATVTLKASENNNADKSRTSIFYLRPIGTEWEYSKAISVSQAKAIPSLTVEKRSISFGGSSGEQMQKVTSNCRWSAFCPTSWVVLSSDQNKGQLFISVSANPKTTYRNSVIYILYGNNEVVTIDVTQSPSSIKKTDYTLSCENTAFKHEVEIDSEEALKSAVSSHSWISINPTEGVAEKNKVEISVSANNSVSPRIGYVAIKTGTSETYQIGVVQKGLYITSEESVDFSSSSESKPLSIQSNTSWTVTEKPNWITLSKESGTGNGEIIVTSSENPNTTSRTGEIVFSQPGLSIKWSVTVSQSGKFIAAETTLLEFSDKEGEKNFKLLSDASWTSYQTDNWFVSSITSGDGNASIKVVVEENETVEDRTGVINYSFVNETKSVIINQQAKYLTIGDQSFSFPSKGGSHIINLSTNGDWSASVEHEVSWLKLSKSSGSDNAEILLTVEDNPTVNTRSNVVVIKTENYQDIRILVSQSPRYLSVSTSSIQFLPNGGISDVVTIDTDGKYTIQSSESWLTVKETTDKAFTVSATKNPLSDMREGKIVITLTDLQEESLSLELIIKQSGEY
ncbi:MAG: BACON domain-containing protein [Muribaculaceae bacterium]|nr:BACON domain-containing protein [Muribaculaceae bacterium]